MLVRTLLFLGAVGLDRTWDLRSYTGDGLGVLTGRPRAYGYFHTERFLSQIAASRAERTPSRMGSHSGQRACGTHQPLQHKRWSLSTTSMGTASLPTLTS